jgi:hypothetical protein
MASDLENSVRSAAEKVAKYVSDVATMTVETKYVEIGNGGDVDFAQAKPIARTVIRLDGDSDGVVPLVEAETGRMEVDADLMDLHQRNVTTAIEYRARLLNALLGVLRPGG